MYVLGASTPVLISVTFLFKAILPNAFCVGERNVRSPRSKIQET